MFFVIAGIQPKTKTLDDQPRMCPSCGLYQAHLQQIDHYFSVFFVPVFRVKRGAPFLKCQSCESVSSESGAVWTGAQDSSGGACPSCGKPIEREYKYCPFCGKPL
jgi:hypothetical protein